MMNMSNSLINLNLNNLNLGNRTKAAKALLKKTSETGVGPFAYLKIKLGAKAKLIEAETEAKVAVIEKQSQIEINDLHRRAVHRFIAEESQYQENMEEVTVKALPLLSENADPNSMDNDWIVNFFNKSRNASDNEIRDLWSRILAGEANTPGSYSKRTVNFLSDLDKSEAALFTKFCGFIWNIGVLKLLVFDIQAEIYNRHGIDFDSVSHLDSIGLIQFNPTTGFLTQNLPKKFSVHYYGRPLALEMPKDAGNDLPIGVTRLTRIGKELAVISGSKPVEGFWEYVKDQWKKYLPKSETE